MAVYKMRVSFLLATGFLEKVADHYMGAIFTLCLMCSANVRRGNIYYDPYE